MLDMISNLLTLAMLVANFSVMVYTFSKFLREPEKKQEDRIEALEDKVAWIDDRLKLGSNHFDSLDDGNRVAQKALIALLGHDITGNNEAELKEAKKELNAYLLRKVVK